MVEYNDSEMLSRMLKAVADGTRRALLTQLCQQGASRVTDLAGLVKRTTMGRTHWIEADLGRVGVMDDWLQSLKSIWALRLEKLDTILNQGEKK